MKGIRRAAALFLAALFLLPLVSGCAGETAAASRLLRMAAAIALRVAEKAPKARSVPPAMVSKGTVGKIIPTAKKVNKNL